MIMRGTPWPVNLSEMIVSTFDLPGEYVDRFCDKYYLLHWEGRYVSKQLLDNYHVIYREGIKYLPIFQECRSADVHFCVPGTQYKLSFRKKREEAFGYVLITPLSQKPKESK